MSLPNLQPMRLLAALVLLAIVPVLAACSFAPVYGGANSQNYNFAFGEPKSRLEQIVYQDLAAHFGRSTDPNAFLVIVDVGSSSLRPGRDTASLEGVVTVTRTDLATGETRTVFKDTRTAIATYGSSPQSLARQQASNEAAERAAHELAQTIRLTLISVMANNGANARPQPSSGDAVPAAQ